MAIPDIIIGQTDHSRLTQLGNGLIDSRPEIGEPLMIELERARVVEDGAVPPGTAQMGSLVEYRVENGGVRRVTLVYPRDADISSGRISILTPIGTALLGLSVGQTIEYLTNSGQAHRLTVLSVDQQVSANDNDPGPSAA